MTSPADALALLRSRSYLVLLALPLGLAGVLVGPTIRYAPGGGGRSPADGYSAPRRR